jgi:hypothetical protein
MSGMRYGLSAGSFRLRGYSKMSVFCCTVCDPGCEPCTLCTPAKATQVPDTCPWSDDGNVPVWRKMQAVE